MVKCFGTTLSLFLLTLLGSLPLGLLVAFGRMSKHWLPRNFTRVYISIMRGTPLMLQMWVVFFGIPKLIPIGSNWRYIAAVIAFIINYAAYFAEIYRSGIESIPAGQYEAAEVLGYGKAQTFFKIILPQVIKRVIPPTGSEFMVLVKDTALAQIIAQPQLFDIAIKTAAKNVSITPYIAAGIFYLIMSAVVEFAFKKLESKLDYYR